MKLSELLLISGIITGMAVLTKRIINTRLTGETSNNGALFDEENIRALAHRIWESEGKPEGHAKRHWALAIELLKSNIADKSAKTEQGDEKNKFSVPDSYSSIDRKDFH